MAWALCAAAAAQPAAKPACAVLTFDAGAGISADEAKFLSDRFTSLLAQAEVYNVVARSRMLEILETESFNRSDHCSATECAVEAGRKLQVRYIIFGTVGRFGDLMSLNTSLVDVETVKIVSSAISDFTGDWTEFGKSAPAENVRRLLKLERPPPATYPAVVDLPVRKEPPVRLPPKPQALYIGPRVGASLYSGWIGGEIQVGHVGLSGGWQYGGFASGLKWYFHRHRSCWYAGLCYASKDNGGDFVSKQTHQWIGAGAGYRWRLGTGWDLTAGSGIAQWTKETRDNKQNEIIPVFDFSVGYSF